MNFEAMQAEWIELVDERDALIERVGKRDAQIEGLTEDRDRLVATVESIEAESAERNDGFRGQIDQLGRERDELIVQRDKLGEERDLARRALSKAIAEATA